MLISSMQTHTLLNRLHSAECRRTSYFRGKPRQNSRILRQSHRGALGLTQAYSLLTLGTVTRGYVPRPSSRKIAHVHG